MITPLFLPTDLRICQLSCTSFNVTLIYTTRIWHYIRGMCAFKTHCIMLALLFVFHKDPVPWIPNATYIHHFYLYLILLNCLRIRCNPFGQILARSTHSRYLLFSPDKYFGALFLEMRSYHRASSNRNNLSYWLLIPIWFITRKASFRRKDLQYSN